MANRVIVIGGGWSGVAAAVSARKAGADVVIIERTDLLLGLGNFGDSFRCRILYETEDNHRNDQTHQIGTNALLRHKPHQNRQDQRGHQSRHHQRQTAYRTAQGADLICLGGTDHMGAGTESYALGDLVGDAEPFTELFAEHVAADAGDGNAQGGDGGGTSEQLRQTDADGGGNTLGQQGNSQIPVKAQQE